MSPANLGEIVFLNKNLRKLFGVSTPTGLPPSLTVKTKADDDVEEDLPDLPELELN